eukprot:TRINITY_DN10688_c0_g1_i2.p1 TRINITY_DN10688_c0_g1~~TRINITY_DN10688_c0_g1_i2.p1  ORF type:complete len:485 (-),score=57.76 TRINITY_DN10688_c0_g1_i2:407-1861(-)
MKASSSVVPLGIMSPQKASSEESSEALLEDSSFPPRNGRNASLVSMMIITCLSLAASVAFGFMFYASRASNPNPNSSPADRLSGFRRPLKKLERPVVILVSSDGFRYGYQYKTATPNIHRLIEGGTVAELGMIPVYPTLTFPNHYSIVTGLYPAWHGIINNYFRDPHTNEEFTMKSHEPHWWLGEPLWETVTKNGLEAATYFWPGSEVVKGPWTCPKGYCFQYNSSVPFEERVDTVLGYFDLDSEKQPSFITLYFEDPDHQGHQVGPDDPQITEAVARIDSLMGRLMDGLESRGVLDDVTIIMVGDHGMVGTCDKKLVYLQDLDSFISIPQDWVQAYTPVLAIRPPPGTSANEVVRRMNEGLSSGKVENGQHVRVFLKEDLPSRLHYRNSDRIPPIIGLLDEGFKVEYKRQRHIECGGAHGYDNSFFSMRTIFFAQGPQFARDRKVPSFENVQIYNLITSLLNISGAPNNGTASFPLSILLPVK